MVHFACLQTTSKLNAHLTLTEKLPLLLTTEDVNYGGCCGFQRAFKFSGKKHEAFTSRRDTGPGCLPTDSKLIVIRHAARNLILLSYLTFGFWENVTSKSQTPRNENLEYMISLGFLEIIFFV